MGVVADPSITALSCKGSQGYVSSPSFWGALIAEVQALLFGKAFVHCSPKVVTPVCPWIAYDK
jgi:hypothetical protein